MNKLLLSDKVPYFFTFLVAIAAYHLNHVVSYVLDSPTVVYEYRVLDSEESGHSTIDDVELTIENLNRKISFSNLILDIKYSSKVVDTPAQVFDPELIAVAPATALPDSVVKSRHNRLNRYEIPKLQPGGIYVARMKTRHDNRIKEFPKVYLNSSDDILFTEWSLEVFFVRNQLAINLGLLCLWLMLIVTYFINLFLYQKKAASGV